MTLGWRSRPVASREVTRQLHESRTTVGVSVYYLVSSTRFEEFANCGVCRTDTIQCSSVFRAY